VVYAVHGQFGFRNANRRNAVMANVQAQLEQKNLWGDTIMGEITSPSGDPGMLVETRFVDQAERDAFWNDLVAYLGGGVNGPTTGSFIRQHDCTHDDEQPTETCVVNVRIEY
jgi:hypothetical protein